MDMMMCGSTVDLCLCFSHIQKAGFLLMLAHFMLLIVSGNRQSSL